MKRKIQKWENSLGIRIPGNIVKDLYLRDGSIVDIEEANTIVIRPQEKHNLDDMINSINDTNMHAELSFGVPEGEEVGQRPAIVLSPSKYNRKTGLLIACPITSKIKGYPFEVQSNGKK